MVLESIGVLAPETVPTEPRIKCDAPPTEQIRIQAGLPAFSNKKTPDKAGVKRGL